MGTPLENENRHRANGIFSKLNSVFSTHSQRVVLPEMPLDPESLSDQGTPAVINGHTTRSSVMVFNFVQTTDNGRSKPSYLVTVNQIEFPQPENVSVAFEITEDDVKQLIEDPDRPIRDKFGFITELLEATSFDVIA